MLKLVRNRGLVLAGVLAMSVLAAGTGLWGQEKEPVVTPPVVANYAPNPANAVVTQRLVNEPTRRLVRLANGLTIILQQNKTAPVVASQVWVKAGSITEQEWMGAGLSHVLEHLLVTGTQGRKVEGGGNMSMLQSLGGDANAATYNDHTAFHITTTTAKWKDALTLLASWTTTNEFTQADFDREYKVVQRELEMGESEAARTFAKVLDENRYLVNPARYPVIGFKPAFQKLTFEDAKTYYKRMYVPDNMFVTVAGDIDLDDAEKFVAANFSHMNRQKVPFIAIPAEPQVTTPRMAVARADVKEARVAWAFPSVTMYQEDMYALDVLSGVLASGNSSVLVRTLRDEKGLVTSINAGDPTPSFAAGELEIVASLAPEKIGAAQEAVMGVLRNLLDKGVDAQEVEKVKQQTTAAHVFDDQTAEQQAERNGEDYLTTGTIDFAATYVAKIKAVTPAEVDAAARKYVRMDRLITTVLLPRSAPDIAAAGAAVAQDTVKQEVKKITLANGATVLLCRNPAAPIVSMQMYTLGALMAEDASDNGIGNAMSRLMARGSQKYSFADISQFFDATGGAFGTSMGSNTFSVSATCLKENAEKSFDIFQDVALHPAFDKQELERIKPQLLAAVDRSTEDWSGEAMKFAKEKFYSQSPYKLLGVGSREVIEKLTPEDIRKHYDKYFRDPAKTVIAVYGDIDVAKMEEAVHGFEEMPKHEVGLNMVSEEGTPGTYLNPTSKETAAIIIGYGPGMTVDSKDKDAMTLVQTIMGGYSSSLGSPLFETLRGKGLVYTVQAASTAGPAKGLFLILALGEPQNADEIVKIIGQIVDDTKAGKYFTDDLIAKALDQAITGEQLQGVTIADSATQAALDELMGLGYDYKKTFAARMRAVTKADLLRVANAYLTKPVVTITTPSAAAK